MNIRSILGILVVASSLAAHTHEASAVPVGASRSASFPWAFLAEGEAELAPLAHVKFCMTHVGECGGEGRTSASALGPDVVALLDRVNREVNRRIRPRSKVATIGEWAINPGAGDCNDYAVTKRHILVSLGMPASTLRLAVVRTRWGEGHLVLVARTQDGDYVLDNLSNRLVRWDQTGHRFLKIQSASDARNWASVEAAYGGPAVAQLAVAPAGLPENESWYLGEP